MKLPVLALLLGSAEISLSRARTGGSALSPFLSRTLDGRAMDVRDVAFFQEHERA